MKPKTDKPTEETPEQKKEKQAEELLELLNARVLLSKRFGKNHSDNVKKWEKDYNIQTIADAKFENLDNQIQIPYIFSSTEGGLANIFENFPSIFIKQRGIEDREFTDFANQTWEYLRDKLSLEESTEDAAVYFLNNGQSSTRYGWDLQLTEVDMPALDPTTGEEIIDPLTGQPQTQKVSVATKNLPYVCIHTDEEILFSPESRFILDDEKNLIPYIVWVQKLRKEQAEEYYGVSVEDEELESINVDELDKKNDMNKVTQAEEAIASEDLKRVKAYSYVGVLPKEKLPEQLQENYHADNVYYTVFSKKKVYKQPEQITKKPVLNLGNYGMPTRFFRFGEAKILRELEQDISLGRSRVMDLRDRQGSKVAIPQGTEFDEASFKRSRDYTFMRYVGNTPPQYINPPPIPDTIISCINMSRDDIQMASAQMDISRASMQNTVATATGQKIFAGETNKRNAKKRKKVARYLRALAKNLLILCGQNWSAEEFSKITDIPVEQIIEQGWVEKLAELGTDYDVEIDIDSMGDTREADAANALALFREMKDRPNINQDELTKFVLKVGFRQKDASRFLMTNITPEMIMMVLEHLAQLQVLSPEDLQVIAEKMDMSGQPGPAQNQPTGQGEGRPPVNNPTEVMQESMQGTDATQMSAQRMAAPKQTNVPKGPQMNRKG